MNEQEKYVLAAFDWMGRAIGSQFTRGGAFEGTTAEPTTLDGKPAWVVTLRPGPGMSIPFTMVLEGWPSIHREEGEE